MFTWTCLHGSVCLFVCMLVSTLWTVSLIRKLDLKQTNKKKDYIFWNVSLQKQRRRSRRSVEVRLSHENGKLWPKTTVPTSFFFYDKHVSPKLSGFNLLTFNKLVLPSSVNGEVVVALFLEIFLAAPVKARAGQGLEAPPSKQANREETQPTSLSDKWHSGNWRRLEMLFVNCYMSFYLVREV